MTTLSKEEFKLLLSNSVASPDLDKVQDAIADLVAENGLTKLALSQKIELLKSCEQALDKSYAENDRLKALSVTNIMVDVVPGDGSGLEVYAKSVDAVVNILSELGEKVEDLESVRAQLTVTRTALVAATEADYFRVQRVADYYLIDLNKLSAAINAYLTRSLD